MAKLVLVNLDMNKNQLLQAVMQAGDAPANPTAGQFYYNTTEKHAYVYNGTAWELMGNVASVVDADFDANSTNAIQNKAVSTGLVKSLDSVPTDSAYTIKGKAANGSEITSVEIPAATDSAYGVVKVDSALKTDSTNPVQNKVINSALGDKADKSTVDTLSKKVFTLETEIASMPADISATSGATAYLLELQDANGDKLGAGATINQATSTNVGVVKLDASVTASGANPVTGKAIYDYVGDAIAASDAMIFKGTIGTGGTVTALPTTYKTGWTYRVITAGTYAGQDCEVGDLIIALVDRDGTGNLDSDWTVAQTNIDGAITSISGTSPISVTGSGASRAIAHKASGVSAGSYGEGSDKTVAFGDILGIPYISVDSTGHITGAEIDAITFPSNVATTKAAGLMSASDKDKLDNTLKLKKAKLVIDPSNTSATATLSVSSPEIIAVEAMYYDDSKGDGYEAVIVDWESDGPTFKASIAQAETQLSIWIHVLYI